MNEAANDNVLYYYNFANNRGKCSCVTGSKDFASELNAQLTNG